MRESFVHAGFGADCEYLFVDNTATNQLDGFAACNLLISRARGERIILVHQDVLLDFDDRRVLDSRIQELEAMDPHWGVLGNAGSSKSGHPVIRISDPHGANQHSGSLPQEVESLDENLLIVRKDAAIGVSHDLGGFHLYAADLCLHARLLGLKCYVIDFHVRHLSAGRVGAEFWSARARFVEKYRRLLRPRAVATPSTWMLLGIPRPFNRLVERRPLYKLVRAIHRLWGPRS